MSIYKNDSAFALKKAIESLINQSFSKLILFIEVDGNVGDEIRSTLDTYSNNNHVEINYNSANKGLAFRLNQVVDKVVVFESVEYIARMDADDICHPDRFKKQVEFLSKNPEVDIVGSSVFEIDEKDMIQTYKAMPTSDSVLKKRLIKQCPFNHPTVMFRRRVFDDGNRYSSDLKNTQDYYLWIDLASKGYKFANIDEPLLAFRIDPEFHSRRGKKKAKNDYMAKVYAMEKLDKKNLKNWSYTFAIYGLRMSPSSISKLAYKYLRNTKAESSQVHLSDRSFYVAKKGEFHKKF
ncbi:glycosyltransferase [Endozoicomonas arenosclerae]|uniref:glycosyltransferase n=1 Tax=Endozoicomonas arenosclerae TaxID=1633495 RepID=UPI0009A15482|nr:glycosyltransferase [Endozoicomonas arenosclerae]